MIQGLRQSRSEDADKIQECHRNIQNTRKTPRKDPKDEPEAEPSRISSSQLMSKDEWFPPLTIDLASDRHLLNKRIPKCKSFTF